MRNTSSNSATAVFNRAYLFVVLAAATMLFLFVPRQAAAQSDALRVLAGRVLQGSVYDRGGVYDRDVYNRDQYERERLARERYCREQRNDRYCDSLYGANETRRGAWCLDRDRNGRCDANYGNYGNSNGKGRGKKYGHDRGRRGWDNDDRDDRGRRW